MLPKYTVCEIFYSNYYQFTPNKGLLGMKANEKTLEETVKPILNRG